MGRKMNDSGEAILRARTEQGHSEARGLAAFSCFAHTQHRVIKQKGESQSCAMYKKRLTLNWTSKMFTGNG